MTLRTGPRALYIYYRVSPAHLAAGLHERVHGMQRAACAACPGLEATLMARTDPDGSSGPDATWMEVYTHPEGVPDTLAPLLTRLMADWPVALALARHTESFAPLAPPSPLD